MKFFVTFFTNIRLIKMVDSYMFFAVDCLSKFLFTIVKSTNKPAIFLFNKLFIKFFFYFFRVTFFFMWFMCFRRVIFFIAFFANIRLIKMMNLYMFFTSSYISKFLSTILKSANRFFIFLFDKLFIIKFFFCFFRFSSTLLFMNFITFRWVICFITFCTNKWFTMWLKAKSINSKIAGYAICKGKKETSRIQQ